MLRCEPVVGSGRPLDARAYRPHIAGEVVVGESAGARRDLSGVRSVGKRASGSGLP